MGKSRLDLEYIARFDRSPEVRIAAIQQLSPNESKSLIEYCAKYDSDERVRVAAVRQLTPVNSINSVTISYCNWCGATPGKPSKCPRGRSGVHNFQSK
jgi:hypothetical protein